MISGYRKFGTTLYDSESMKILEGANFDVPNINCYLIMTDGSFIKDKFSPCLVFEYKTQLYYFLVSDRCVISGFFKLNMSRKECINGSFGAYYEIGNINKGKG